MDPAEQPLNAEILEDRVPPPPPVWHGWLMRLGSVLWVVVCIWALYGLHKEWSEFHLADLDDAFARIGPQHLALALGFTVVSYSCNAVLGILGQLWTGTPVLHPGRAFIANFICSAFSINAGGTVLGGGSIRMRFAKARGMSAGQVGKITAFSGIAGWAGHSGLCGVLLLLTPPPLEWLPQQWVKGVAIILLVLCGCMIFAGRLWPKRWPGPGLALLGVLVSAVDWLCAGLAMWALFPGALPMDVWSLVAVVVVAQALAAFTHVPGGIGVLEYAVTKALAGVVAAPLLAGTLVTYRLLYYLLPFFVGIVLFGARELRLRRELIARGGALAMRGWSFAGPRLASLLALGGGLMLLISANTPMEPGRRSWLVNILPLPFVEGSHFLSSLAGALLVVLARGLQRRIRAAWVLTVGAMAAGIVFSLTKGLDWEESVALAFMLACLIPFRSYFHRHSSLWTYRFTPSWWLTLIALLGFSIWIGFFTARHIPYQNKLWWQFAMEGDASRFLRGASGAICVFLIVALAQALRPVRPRVRTPVEPGVPEKLVAASDHSDAALALLGDKEFMVSTDGLCGLMFADQGRSRIVMGDPLGDPSSADDLLWRFVERARDEGMRPVFYSITVAEMPRFVDMGFKLFKLGEEARSDLRAFDIDSSAGRRMRKTRGRFERSGCTFTIWDRETVAREMPALRRISDAWLSGHKAGEKRFSLGCFSEDYVSRFPCAVVLDAAGQPVAFANLWATVDKEELSVDLMRHLPEAPPGVMEVIFIELMIWGSREGYHWFNLGMAPLSGLSTHALAPLWHKLAGGIFHRGESLYNFQGLRGYKDKFDPEWQPRYVAVQDTWALPTALFDATVLIGGGLRNTLGQGQGRAAED